MRNQNVLRLALVVVAVTLARAALAAAPEIISYQGLLTDDQGVVVENGPYDLRFRIFDAPTAGTPLFEQPLQVTVIDGLYNVLLSTNVLPSGAALSQVFANGMTYMEVAIEDGPGISVPITLAPRQQIASVPYALQVNAAPSGIPSGGIIMWSGSPAAIPEGWALCDGNGQTPDLRGRFIVSYDDQASPPAHSDAAYGIVGNTGGEKAHTLTSNEMPSHDHDFELLANTAAPGSGSRIRDFQGTIAGQTGTRGGGQPHENRPPYYVLAFIMKL